MTTSDSSERMILPMVPPRGLLEAILEEVRRHCAERGISDCAVTLDIADRHVLQVDPATVRDILAGLLLRAFENASRPTGSSDAPHVREIVVTSIEHAAAIEIEVADSGPMSPDGSTDAAIESLVAAVGGAVSVSACPEGGRAVTLRLPHRRLGRLAA